MSFIILQIYFFNTNNKDYFAEKYIYMTKKILLRILDEKVYPALQKKGKEKRWSVNTLINSILEESLKKDKKNTLVS